MLIGVLNDAKGVLTDPAKGVLVVPRALLAGVLALLGFILIKDHFPKYQSLFLYLLKVEIKVSAFNFVTV